MRDDLDLSRALLPGFGFFGATEQTALRIPVSATIDSVVIRIASETPEVLNIGGIHFHRPDGQRLRNEVFVESAELSSIFGKVMPEEVLARVHKGVQIHSKRERQPSLRITLTRPLEIGSITVHNRAGPYGARARLLQLDALRNGEVVAHYDNDAPERRLAILADLRKDLAAAGLLPDIAPGTGAEATAEAYRAAITAHIDSGRSEWPPDVLALLLDLFRQPPPKAGKPAAAPKAARAEGERPRKGIAGQLLGTFAGAAAATPAPAPAKAEPPAKPEPTAFELLVCGEIMCRLRGTKKSFPTKALGFLAPVLNRRAHIDAAVDMTNRLIAAREPGAAPVVLSKHMMHESKLRANQQAYLDALDAFFALCPDLGVEACLCYGTLLGAVREGEFLAHDDDVDLLVISGATTKEEAWANREALFRKLAERGFSVSGENSNFTLRIAGAGLDLFLCWESEGQLNLMMERYQFRDIPAAKVLPLSTIRFHGRDYPAPANPEAFLEERYGETWMVSDPYHEWPWALE